MFAISVFSHYNYNNYLWYCHFYVNTDSKTLYFLTSSTDIPASFLSTSSDSIVTPTPTLIQGK